MTRFPLRLSILLPLIALAACTAEDSSSDKDSSAPHTDDDHADDGGDSGDGGGDDGGDSGDSGDGGGDDSGDSGDGGGDDGGGDDGGGDDGGGDDGGGDDGGGDDGGGDDGGPDELVFAAAVVALDVQLTPELSVLGDLDGDGSLDVIGAETEMKMSWYRGDGAGGFSIEASSELDAVLLSVKEAGEDEAGFDGTGESYLFESSTVPTAGGDRLLVGIQIHDGGTGSWAVAFGLIASDGAGGWTSSLLTTASGWGSAMPLADIDGDGSSEVLIDAEGGLRLLWGGDPAQEEVIATAASGSVYPAAWTTTVDGTERGFVLLYNGGFGFTEASSWTPSRGMEIIASDFYSSDAHARVRQGLEADEIWLYEGETLLRFAPGAPASFATSTPAVLADRWPLVTGDFTGSGRLSAVTQHDEAVQVAADGSIELMALTADEFSYSAQAADIDGDGLDDLISFDWSEGILWMENVSDR